MAPFSPSYAILALRRAKQSPHPDVMFFHDGNVGA
jgi:hypothetical protein